MPHHRSDTAKGPSQRQRRAGELIRHALCDIFVRDEVHATDMPDTPVTVTEVRTSPDLRHATVYCTVLGKPKSTAEIDALNRVAPKIRQVLGRNIDLKFTPALIFRRDDSFEAAARIDALLDQEEVKRDIS